MLRALGDRLDRAVGRLTGGRRRPGEPPLVPARAPFLGHAVAFGRDVTGLLRACQAHHGDVFTLLIAGRRMTFVLDPLCYPDVLKADALSFDAIADEFSTRAFGHAPSAAVGVDPEAMRRIFTESLKGPALTPLAARTHERLQSRFAAVGGREWQEDHLYAFVHRHVFAVNMETLFGDGAPTPVSEAAFRILDDAFPLMVAGVPARLLRGVRGARARLVAALDVERDDASVFVRARDDYFRGQTRADRHFRNHAQLSALWAAEANTIPAIFWALFYLLREDAARAAVLAELRAIDGDLAHPATLKRLPLCQSAAMEALRLSSSSLVVREVTRAFTLELVTGDRYDLRAGDRVCLCPPLNHLDPEIFAEPRRFRVDRFVGGDGPPQFTKRGKRLPLALMPFGAGVSMCPGRFLASNEIVQAIAAVLLRFEIELVDRAVPELDHRRAGLGILPPRSDPAFRYRRA